ncbi:MAG: LLM class flavin-dependent oxidoreductase [Candidatus Caldarchaeum sp.]
MSFCDGFGIAPFSTYEETVMLAEQAELLNISSFWLGEGYYGRSAISLLSVVASRTRKIGLGTSVVGVYTRHPSILAMEAVTIDEISQGRFTLGIGINVSALVKHGLVKDQSSVAEAKPYSAIKDSIRIIRILLGNGGTYSGKVYRLSIPSKIDFHGFKPIRSNVPIYVGSRSPRILELAGEEADGAILSRFLSSSERYVKDCVSYIMRGLERAGKRWEDFTLAANLNFSVDTNRERAKRSVREAIALYIADPTLAAVDTIDRYVDLSEREVSAIKDAMKLFGLAGAAKAVSDSLVDQLSVSGTPEDCVEKLRSLIKNGVKLPIAFDVIGPEPRTALKLIADEIIPNIVKNGGKG